MQKTYQIEVDCANCAAKMEVAAGKLEGVAAVTVNYMTQKMTVVFAEGADVAATIQAVAKTCKKIDSDFSIEL
ncbi:MAG: heavy-metal-associated domain-containing protein [Ruminococcaceae bacterium]|nr:heavy-metal-associated domain-containing protein [Oscillospiraceae bacterium]